MSLLCLKKVSLALLILLLFVPMLSPKQLLSEDDWVQQSNAHAEILVNIFAKSYPEAAAQWGVSGYDTEIRDLSPGFDQRLERSLQAGREQLTKRITEENHPAVSQDIEILLATIEQSLKEMRLENELLIPYFNLPDMVYQGLRNLLDDQVAEERRPAALKRLSKYTGSEDGYTSIFLLAENYLRAEIGNGKRLGPFLDEVEKDLENSKRYLTELDGLFQKYGLSSYKSDFDILSQQTQKYNEFISQTILPLARSDFRLPEKLYVFQLMKYGVDMPVAVLVQRAQVSFKELQNNMTALAKIVARQRGLKSEDYRDVIRQLKNEQLHEDSILSHYRERIRDLECIIRQQAIVTLPERDIRIRLATEAESARLPAPFMRPPRLIGNTGEQGEFVLPLKYAGGGNGEAITIDDFTHDAAAWPLAVHEGRPGHEMQYAAMVEKGVSQARMLFAFNSVNVEGWALYMEEEMKPYLPAEGQLMTMWSRAVRAARAFLDPGVNRGTISKTEAMRLLSEELVLSEAMTKSEVERYMFRAPGQATSYLCGYLRLMEIRTEAELALGNKFNRRAYHDFILSQGLLPPAQLRSSVMQSFVANAK